MSRQAFQAVFENLCSCNGYTFKEILVGARGPWTQTKHSAAFPPLYYPVGPNHYLLCAKMKRWLPDTFTNRNNVYLVNSKPTAPDPMLTYHTENALSLAETDTSKVNTDKKKLKVVHVKYCNITFLNLPEYALFSQTKTPIMLMLCSKSAHYARIIVHAFWLKISKAQPIILKHKWQLLLANNPPHVYLEWKN